MCMIVSAFADRRFGNVYSFFSPFFFSPPPHPPSKEIKSEPWQERVKSLADLPSAWNLQTLPCPSLLLSWGNTLPCCSLRLWQFASLPGPPALMWGAGCPLAGCCCPGLGFTLQNARRDVLSRTIHFEGSSHPQRFLTLHGRGSLPWCRPQVAAPSCSSCFAGFLGLFSKGRSSPPGGRQQLCQVSCQSEGPPWQGSGEPTQRVKQLPLGTLHRPSFDLSLAVWLVRRIILAWGIFLNWTYFHHGSRLAVRCLCCCKSNSYNFW